MKHQRNYQVLGAIFAIASILLVFVGLIGEVPFLNQVWGDVSTNVLAVFTGAAGAGLSVYWSRRTLKRHDSTRVFIVYAREDLAEARHLAGELVKRGLHPWLDVDEVTPGQVWQSAVLGALDESAAALVLVSKHLSKSGFVQEELKSALGRLQQRHNDISPVIPVRLDDQPVPDALSHVQWVSLREENAMDRLEAGIRRLIE